MRILLIFAIAFFPLGSFAASPEGILVEKFSKDMHILKGRDYGTNIGVVAGPKGVVIVDPMPGESKLLLDSLYAAVVNLHKVAPKYILNTHKHSDHAGGNDYFIDKGTHVFSGDFGDIGFEHIVVRSHSSEDHIYYHRASNSIFVGDVFDTSWHPTFYAGGIVGLNDAVDKILQIGNESSLIVPGHGRSASKGDLSKFRDNALEWVARVRLLLSKKKTLEDILNDPVAREILQRFNLDNKPNFLPEKAIRRFTERTIAMIENEAYE